MHELRFHAGVHSVEDRIAVFYLMNTSVNRNRWTVTGEALEQALPTIIGKPLGCGPGYVTDRHYVERLHVGVFTSTRKPDGYALGSAEISDDEAWRRLTAGEWGPISVVITSFLERCSVCGVELTGDADPFSHGCIAEGRGHLVVESFTFDRVDFIESPAYPQAGLIRATDMVVPIELLAGFYNSQSNMDPAQGPGARLCSNPEEEEEKMSENEEYKEQIRELEEQNRELEQQLTEKGELETQVTELKSQLSEIQETQHKRLVEETLEARMKTELVDDAEKEREYLSAKTDEELEGLQKDAVKVASVLLARESPPKSRYTASDVDGLKTAMDETRLRLFGRKTE
ncbi:MAG: hypothetical protein NWE89_11805 [Candidatus Bathyarchaeota archaeon]|nr:hypothetical protein [Candidatus Bathyarchaeota archaeon]